MKMIYRDRERSQVGQFRQVHWVEKVKVTQSKPPTKDLVECNKEECHKYTLQTFLGGQMHIFFVFKNLEK